jgi:hypothetical protein
MMPRLLSFIFAFGLLATPAITAFFWPSHSRQQVRVVRAQLPPQ